MLLGFDLISVGIAVIAALAVLSALTAVVIFLVRRRRTAGFARLNQTLPINSAWWREQRQKSGDLLYVAVGDSAAQGIGASRPGRSYVGLIAAHVRKRTGSSVRVVNLSVAGARLRETIATQLPALKEMSPDLVTVAVGANDMADFDRHRFKREVEELLSNLPADAIVADLPTFYIGKAQRNTIAANRMLREALARHGFTIAPLHAATKRQGIYRYALNQVAADFFHPNDRGYAVWALAFIPALDALLERRGYPVRSLPQ